MFKVSRSIPDGAQLSWQRQVLPPRRERTLEQRFFCLYSFFYKSNYLAVCHFGKGNQFYDP